MVAVTSSDSKFSTRSRFREDDAVAPRAAEHSVAEHEGPKAEVEESQGSFTFSNISSVFYFSWPYTGHLEPLSSLSETLYRQDSC